MGKRCVSGKFTIVELIIAIACVFVVAMVVLPAFDRTARISYRIYCLNNIWLYTKSWGAYSELNNGWLMSAVSRTPGNARKYWFDYVHELSGEKNSRRTYFYDPAYAWSYAKTEKVFNPDLIPYGYNFNLGYYFQSPFGYLEYAKLRLEQVKRPSLIIAFADSDDDAFNSWRISSAAHPIGMRHFPLASIGFVDGHCSFEKPQYYTRPTVIHGSMDYSALDGKPNVKTSASGHDTHELKQAWGDKDVISK